MSGSKPLAGIVLAAGAGTRFGGPKAIVSFDGELLVDRAIGLLRRGGCRPTIVVLGAVADEVIATAALDADAVVVATDWSSGMSASLRAGLAEAQRLGAAAAVVALVDQPWIGPEAIIRLRAAWDDGAIAAVAAYDGAPRNPVLIDGSAFAAVSESVSGDRGAREWLQANPDQVVIVDCTDTGDPSDVDRPEDVAR